MHGNCRAWHVRILLPLERGCWRPACAPGSPAATGRRRGEHSVRAQRAVMPAVRLSIRVPPKLACLPASPSPAATAAALTHTPVGTTPAGAAGRAAWRLAAPRLAWPAGSVGGPGVGSFHKLANACRAGHDTRAVAITAFAARRATRATQFYTGRLCFGAALPAIINPFYLLLVLALVRALLVRALLLLCSCSSPRHVR